MKKTFFCALLHISVQIDALFQSSYCHYTGKTLQIRLHFEVICANRTVLRLFYSASPFLESCSLYQSSSAISLRLSRFPIL